MTGLILTPSLSICKQNMLELVMLTWIDCKLPIIFYLVCIIYLLVLSFLDVMFCVGSEWAVNIQRDSYASYVGHYPILAYFAIAENESIGRERYNFMQVCSICYSFCILLFFKIVVWWTYLNRTVLIISQNVNNPKGKKY